MQTITINLIVPERWSDLSDKQLRYVYQLITDEFSCKRAQSSNLFDPMPKEPPDIDENPETVHFWCHLSNIFASNRSEACAIAMQTFNDCIHYMSENVTLFRRAVCKNTQSAALLSEFALSHLLK